MSLNYDLTKVDKAVRAEQFPPGPNGEMNPVTECMIFMTMHVGIGSLTAATAPEFYARAHMIERLHGRHVSRYDAEHGEVIEGIQPADVVGHIGLSTNVFPMLTRQQFLKRHASYTMDQDAQRAALLIPATAKPVASARVRKVSE